jgi:Arc/MetJ-type ribon-helix-helix transcriptional regulator
MTYYVGDRGITWLLGGFTMGMNVVSIKLVDAELQALDQVVVVGKLASRSAAIRAGLAILFYQHKLTTAQEYKIEKERRRHRPRDRRRWGKGTDVDPAVFTQVVIPVKTLEEVLDGEEEGAAETARGDDDLDGQQRVDALPGSDGKAAAGRPRSRKPRRKGKAKKSFASGGAGEAHSRRKGR